MEPDPLGQPADDQGDVHAADGLPLPVPGSGRGQLSRRLLAVVLIGLAAVPVARAGVYVDRAAAHFASNPVYVDPAAKPTLTTSQAARLRDEIGSAGAGPVYVAILPAAARNEAGGDAGALLQALYRAVGQPGTYAVVAGGQFRAGSNSSGFRKGEVPRIATAAFEAHHTDGLAATLLDFVRRLGDARHGGGGSGGGGGTSLWPIVIGAGAIGAVFYAFRRRRRRAEEQRQLAEVAQTAREDLVALANDIDGVRSDTADPASHEELERALALYDRASKGLDAARRPQDLEPVSAALEEGRFLMARAQARESGRALPERTPPCFFDPRHGPSTREVEWTPPGGTPRRVPACEADAQRVERGLEPASREVAVGGRMLPYYAAPPYFGPYFGGFGLGGFLPGLLVGELLSGGFGAGPWGAPDTGSDVDDFGDAGDLGGGDFGGGDFGGGDGGGGDF